MDGDYINDEFHGGGSDDGTVAAAVEAERNRRVKTPQTLKRKETQNSRNRFFVGVVESMLSAPGSRIVLALVGADPLMSVGQREW